MAQPIRGAIAAGHGQTAAAGLEMLRLGGNAFDAAIAAVLASFVVEPMLTSIGGGGFLLAHPADGRNVLFDFFTHTPRTKREDGVDFYPVQVDFGDSGVTQEFHVGLGSIAVPGSIAGLFRVHERLGRLPLAVLAEPAIDYAKTGVAVSAFQAYCFQILRPIALGTAESRRVFAGGTDRDAVLTEGMLLVMPDLAETLAYLVAEGARGFYEGEIAAKLVRDCRELGGYLTREDLRQYQVVEREPLVTRYRSQVFLTNPPPSSGGTLIGFALALLSRLPVDRIKFGTLEHLQVLAEVMRLTNVARKDGYDDRLYEERIAAKFLSESHLDEFDRQLGTAINKWGSTTHVSVVDGEGNAASVTTSNGEGSSYVIPGTGVMMNNMLGEADLHPQGFHQWRSNQRISSMMAPTIVLQDQRPAIVLGSGGSNRIRTAILQVISNWVDFGLSIEAAVNSPRVHWENEVFSVEPGFEALVIDRSRFPFNQTLECWERENMFFGGVHAVSQSETGELSGAGDRRRGGVFLQC